MRRGWVVLVLCAIATTGDDEVAIRKLFAVPAALPGKLAYDEYRALLAARGYRAERMSVNEFRPYLASYLGDFLHTHCTVRRIHVGADGRRGVAVVDHGGTVYRWFLVKGKDRWRYCDFEMIDWGLRFSDALDLPAALEAAFDALESEKLDDAAALQRRSPLAESPKTVQACRLFLLARVLYQQDENEEALKLATKATGLGVDIPELHLLRARAANDAGSHEQAAESARKYLAAVGDDLEGYYALGRALRLLDKRPEAIAAHQSGLRVDASDGANVLGLFLALPKDRKAEAVPHFMKLEPLPDWFEWVAWDLHNASDWEALSVLLAAFREKHPDHKEVPPYEARLLMAREKCSEAADRILAFLPRQMEEARHGWAETYLDTMRFLKKPLEGYARLAIEDRDAAWSSLAAALSDAGDVDTLEALLALRRELKQPGLALPIWEVDLLWRRKRYAEVDQRVRRDAGPIENAGGPHAWRPFDRRFHSLLRLAKTDELAELAQDDRLLAADAFAALRQRFPQEK